MDRYLVATALSLALMVCSIPAHAISTTPPAPEFYVLDEPGILTVQERAALGSILIEHDHSAGEQIFVAIFKSLEDQDLATQTHQVFLDWKIGMSGRNNGALLAVYEKEGKAYLEAGYGLDGRLGEKNAQVIIRKFLKPELAAGNPYRALGLSVLEILRVIESPLIESGRAELLLHAGGLQGSLKPVENGFSYSGWLIWLALGTMMLLFVLNNLLAAEAHFTSHGWFRPNPWRRMMGRLTSLAKSRNANPFTGGGAYGEW